MNPDLTEETQHNSVETAENEEQPGSFGKMQFTKSATQNNISDYNKQKSLVQSVIRPPSYSLKNPRGPHYI